MFKLLVMAMLGAAIAWGTAGVASAATQSVPTAPAPPAPPGGFSTIVTTQTVPPTGGTFSTPVAGSDVTVHVPAGAFSQPVQIVITDADPYPPAGWKVVTGVGVEVYQNGAPYPGPFLKPITIDLASEGIVSSSKVGKWNGSAWVLDTSAMVTDDMVSISMDSSPAWWLVASPTTVPSATTPVTGEPFFGEGILAGLLVLGGTGAIFTSRRRRVIATSTGPVQELPVREEGLGHLPQGAPACPRQDNSDTGPREATTRKEGKAVYGSTTRSRVTATVIVGLTTAALAACSAGGISSEQPTRPIDLKPRQIFGAPKNLLAAGQPQPNGTFWALAGNAASKGLFDINLSDGEGIGSVSVSNTARSVTESLGDIIGLALGASRAGALELLDGTTGKVIKTISLGAPARDVTVGSDGATFYVLDGMAKSASVTVVNSQTDGVQGTFAVPLNTVSIAPDSQGDSVYALQPDGQVSQVAVAGGQIMASFPTGSGARSIALSPDGSTLYVLRNVGKDANVARVSVATESVLQVLPAAAHSVQVLVSADGNELYQLVGTSQYGNIQVFKS